MLFFFFLIFESFRMKNETSMCEIYCFCFLNHAQSSLTNFPHQVISPQNMSFTSIINCYMEEVEMKIENSKVWIIIIKKGMNQKFINLVEKTQKKTPLFQIPKNKRFARKRSKQSDQSIQSKISRQTAVEPIIKYNQLENTQLKQNKIRISTGDFFQQLAHSIKLVNQPQTNKQRYARGRTDRNSIEVRRQSCESKGQNFQYHNQALTAELEVRNKELQVVVSECQIIKESLKNEEQKRRKLQIEKKQISGQLSQKINELQKLQIDNKKLIKQKQYLIKQIEFLQRINYDDKTRNTQSYRQKYLAKEIEQLRKQINMSKSEIQRHLENEIKRMSDQKYSIEKLYHALKLEKETLIKQFQQQRIIDKHSVLHSEEYCKLRQKYKLCLDAYKRLKLQYIELQKELNRSLKNIPSHILNSDASLTMLLSSSSSEKSDSSLDKENTCMAKVKKNNFFAESNVVKTHMKKSLSPRIRDDKQDIDFKKPISPVSHRKTNEDANVTSFSEAKIVSKQMNQKPEKKPTYFNEEYRMKIGLLKNPSLK